LDKNEVTEYEIDEEEEEEDEEEYEYDEECLKKRRKMMRTRMLKTWVNI